MLTGLRKYCLHDHYQKNFSSVYEDEVEIINSSRVVCSALLSQMDNFLLFPQCWLINRVMFI